MRRRKENRGERRKSGMSNLEEDCHNSEGGSVLETVVIATVGQTQETAGGDDITRAK